MPDTTPSNRPQFLEPLETRRLLSAAATAVLLKDINTSGAGAPFGPSAQLGDGAILFELNERELWRTDGTAAGTTFVKSLTKLGSHVAGSEYGSSQYWTSAGGQVFFRAYDHQNGWELWKSDGTPDGTGLVKNIRPDTPAGVQSSSPFSLTNFKDNVVFFADDGAHGVELWKSDGTEAGTVLLKDLQPGSHGSAIEPIYAFPPPLFATVGDTLYFTANTGVNGFSPQELWKTDGTPKGTVVVPRQYPDPILSLANVGGRLVVGSQILGAGIWELHTYNPGTPGTWTTTRAPLSGAMIEAGSLAFFRGRNSGPASDRGLWRTDGTAAGTFQVKDFPDVNYIGNFVHLADGVVTFTARDAQGDALWRSDGTREGTILLHRLLITPTYTLFGLTAMRFGDHAYYSVTATAEHGEELWRTDGTVTGTTLVADLNPGPLSSLPRMLGRAGDDVIFYADDGPRGHELWKTNGTFSGTGLVTEFNPANDPSEPANFTRVGDVVFFTARTDEHGVELWKTDGTAAGTVLVKDILPGPAGGNPFSLVEMGGRLFFVAADGAGDYALWTSDGTPDGTRLLKDPRPAGKAFVVGNAYAVATDSHVFFLANDGTHGYEFWSTDGTPEGTRLLRDVAPGNDGLDFPDVAVAGGLFYFQRLGNLWRSDGTPDGTILLRDETAGTIDQLTPAPAGNAGDDEILYFVNGGANELWRTDGSVAGTARVFTTATNLARITGLTPFAGALYFFQSEPTGASEHRVTLYRTGGTPGGGAEPVGVIQSNAYVEPTRTKVVANTMYFIASERNAPSALWRTDGTLAGTRRIDTDPGVATVPSNVVALDDFNGTLAFYTQDPTTSHTTLWLSDGTEAGTRPVHDRGPAGTWPRAFDAAVLDGRVVFAGYDPLTGAEPHLLVNTVPRTITGTDAADHWTIRNVAADRIGVWRSGTGRDQPPDFEWPKAEVASLTFVGLGGDDTVFISGDASFPLVFDGGDGTDRVGSLCKNDDLTGNFETIDVHDGYDLTIHGQFDFDSITLTAQGRLILAAGSDTTVRTRALDMDVPMGDLIDVNDNTLVVEGGDPAAVEAMVAAGRDGGPTRWDGRGIKSTFAATGSPLKGLNVVQVGDDVVVKYGYNGDANLDGRVNADDYFRIDQGFLAQAANPRYAQGDFNYDGKVNADDYFLIDQAFLGQGAPSAGIADESPRISTTRARAVADTTTSDARRRQRRVAVRGSPLSSAPFRVL